MLWVLVDLSHRLARALRPCRHRLRRQSCVPADRPHHQRPSSDRARLRCLPHQRVRRGGSAAGRLRHLPRRGAQGGERHASAVEVHRSAQRRPHRAARRALLRHLPSGAPSRHHPAPWASRCRRTTAPSATTTSPTIGRATRAWPSPPARRPAATISTTTARSTRTSSSSTRASRPSSTRSASRSSTGSSEKEGAITLAKPLSPADADAPAAASRRRQGRGRLGGRPPRPGRRQLLGLPHHEGRSRRAGSPRPASRTARAATPARPRPSPKASTACGRREGLFATRDGPFGLFKQSALPPMTPARRGCR